MYLLSLNVLLLKGRLILMPDFTKNQIDSEVSLKLLKVLKVSEGVEFLQHRKLVSDIKNTCVKTFLLTYPLHISH